MEKNISIDKQIFGHPVGLFMLFFTEMWERFSYYGMRALLVLYLVSEVSSENAGLGWTSSEAGDLYGWYTMLVYITPIIGGILADKIFGFRKAIVIGAVLMTLGHLSLAFEPLPAFYLGLGLLIVGNGFFKPNISSIVGQLYSDDSDKKDAGYTIFYQGINVGAFLGSILCGYLGETYGWHWGFGLAGIFMLIGLIQFQLSQKMFGDIGLAPVKNELDKEEKVKEPLTKKEKERLVVVGVLAFFSIFFWAAFEQAGTSLTLFAKENVNRMVGGWEMPATMTQFFNPFFIITFGSLFSWMWIKLDAMGKNPSIPMKFSYGILQLGAGFLVTLIGMQFVNDNFQVPLLTLVFLYMLHTTGELFLSPIGLSMVTKLAPKQIAGTAMGGWFLSFAMANYLAGAIATLTGGEGHGGEAAVLTPQEGLDTYIDTFSTLGFVLIGFAVLIALLSKPLNKLMHGVV